MDDFTYFIEEIRKIQPKFSRLYSRILSQANLTQPQYALLLELMQWAPKPMTMTAISRKLFITKPAVTSLVDRLEKHQFLKRLDHPKDRRVSLIEIQSRGKKVVSQVQAQILKLILQSAEQFTRQERVIIQRFYSILSKSIDETMLPSKRG